MTRLVVDNSLRDKLLSAQETLMLCDESGERLGYFKPDNKAMYEGVDSPLSEDELDRRSQEPGGRTLTEIMRDLEGRL
jgi:hypothetical protein